jgi:hypothetical protein
MLREGYAYEGCTNTGMGRMSLYGSEIRIAKWLPYTACKKGSCV